MATKVECRKCIHREDCPILLAMKIAGAKNNESLRKKCISHKDKK